MGLDTLYRPRVYSDVLGQESTIEIFREVVKKKQGFHQSYCLSGPFGTGKTTLARIFAKALMCDDHQEGLPCEKCESCKISNADGSHPDITEIDAASNSRKEDMERILEEIKHSSFSGKHRLYIVDESHELSKAAQDAILLPLENTLPGSEDKRLVCIFCTTEPSKMRPAILSRCAPSFPISLVSPEKIAERLAFVCEDQNIEYDHEALVLLAEICESHIRDALKAIESLGSFGKMTKERILEYMHLDYNDSVLDILLSLGEENFTTVLKTVDDLTMKVSPSFLYKKFSEYSILAFKASESFPLPSYLKKEKVQKLHEKKTTLLKWAKIFSSKPYNSTKDSLVCDLYYCDEIEKGFDPTLRHNSFIKHDQKTGSDGSIKAEVTEMGVFVNTSARKGSFSVKETKSFDSEEDLKEEDFQVSLSTALAGFSKNGQKG